jgi:hypothetical protein
MTTSQPASLAARMPSRATGTGSPSVTGRERLDADLLGVDLELADRGGTLEVAGDHHDLVPLALHQRRELAGGGRLPRPLEAGEDQHVRRGTGQVERCCLAPERAGQLGVDGLDDLLGRVEGLADLLTDERLAESFDDALDDLEVDVRLEQREPDLLEGRVDRLLVEASAAADLVEGGLELGGERVEHGGGLVGSWGRER